ncbi:hypothetical protein BSL78_20197 [Apostichopus japonicus]|uniref:Uncharacterized protein n=1 Tax=Stichopus japonicus TaxID=307972 RepID=A0A2G8K4M4_STIJA|nr:hypothetical protein BSL78_20197 [Apostichopus japonicus]
MKAIKESVTIAQHEESAFNIVGIEAKDWSINNIACSGDGNFVITGMTSKLYSHITVVNRKGEEKRQDKISNMGKFFAWRYCCPLSKFNVITACKSDIGIYDVRDGAYSKKNICDVITRWSSDQYVSCVTTDPVKNYIIVGTDSREVFVFTDKMKYSYMFTLPDVIDAPHDISVHRGTLLVCGNLCDRAYAVTMEESES